MAATAFEASKGTNFDYRATTVIIPAEEQVPAAAIVALAAQVLPISIAIATT